MRVPAFFLFVIILLSGCIKDDFILDTIDPELSITNPISTLGFGDSYQFTARYLNNVGLEETLPVSWQSTDASVATIDNNGLAMAQMAGSCMIIASVTDDTITVYDSIMIMIDSMTMQIMMMERSGSLQTTSSYKLTGDFTLRDNNGSLVLEFADNYDASTGIPGLYVYLTNNPASFSGALELGRVSVFRGAHSYTIPAGTALNDYDYVLYFCKPFNVKVGDGEFTN